MSNSNNDDYDSDESLSTEEIGDTSIESLEENEVNPPEIKTEEEPIKKRKKAPICEEKKEQALQAKEEVKLLKAQKKREYRLRKKQEDEASKRCDKVIIQQKEKVVYMVQNEDGNFLEMDPSDFKKSQIRALNQEKENLKKEIEVGRKLPRLLNGKVKVPKERTEKQKAVTAKLVAMNKAKREQRKLNKAVESDINIQESVSKAVKDVLMKPKKDLVEKKRSEQPVKAEPSPALKFF